jgi:hypothetical protein
VKAVTRSVEKIFKFFEKFSGKVTKSQIYYHLYLLIRILDFSGGKIHPEDFLVFFEYRIKQLQIQTLIEKINSEGVSAFVYAQNFLRD